MRIVCNNGGHRLAYCGLSEIEVIMKVEDEIAFLSRPELGYKVERTADGFIARDTDGDTIKWTIKN